jgi:cyclopropane fatty-acyl-phospholipid synthase-like methyltransferase
MISPAKSSAAFFEAKYQRDVDPWNFEASTYERNRYAHILRSLEGRRWRSALEPGCSVGVLTEGLAQLCEQLLALDFSATAMSATKERCKRFPHVNVSCLGLEEIQTFGDFDLIVLSEIGYYFTERRWAELSRRIAREMRPSSTVLAAHWTGSSEDHEITGDRVHEILLAHPELRLEHSEQHAGFRLDRLEKL